MWASSGDEECKVEVRCIYRYRRQWDARRACARDVRCFVRIDSRERGIVLFCVRSPCEHRVPSRAGLLNPHPYSLRVGRVGVRRLFDFIHKFAYITAASFSRTASDKEQSVAAVYGRRWCTPTPGPLDPTTSSITAARTLYTMRAIASPSLATKARPPIARHRKRPWLKERNDRDRRSCHSSPRCGTALDSR